MAVRQRKPARAAVIGRGDIYNLGRVWIEKRAVVDAVRVLVHINPGFGRSGIQEIARLLNVLVNAIPGTALRVALADADVARDAAHPLAPAFLSLRSGEIPVGRTSVDIL